MLEMALRVVLLQQQTAPEGEAAAAAVEVS